MAELRPEERDVLLLTAWGGLSVTEIATATSVPVATARSRLHRVRARLRRRLAAMRADISPVKPRRTRWLVAAAAVVLLTVGMVVVQTLDFGDGAPRASAADVLNKAARLAANTTDQPVGPGQYLYVSRRSEGITFFGDDGDAVARAGIFQDIWIPADPRDDWLERRGVSEKPSWIPGHEGDDAELEQAAGLAGE